MSITKNEATTILVGMTGGIESTVAAYLLKKQGHKVIGIAVTIFDDEINPGPFKEFAISDLQTIKEICESLDIPFYAINGKDEFQAYVIDPLIGRILSGHVFEPIVAYNQMLLKILREKGKTHFNTNFVATGHYAKVLKNQKSGVYELMVANDLEHDQSYELSALSKEDLESIILPLSELQKIEVLKVFDLIKVEKSERHKKSLHEIIKDERFVKFIEERSSKDLRRTGNIYDHRNEQSIGEHKGIHYFRVGMNNIFIKQEVKIDPLLEVISIVPFKGNIFLDYPNRLKFKTIYLQNIVVSHHYDTSLPLIGHVKLGPKSDKHPCKVFFQNNGHAIVELDKEEEGYLLVPGSYIAFYHRKADKGKVFVSGTVELSGNFMDGYEFFTLPMTASEEKREEGLIRKPFERLNF